MTDALLDHDVEIINLTDYEFEPPCEGRPGTEDCDRVAEWYCILSCGHDRLWCQRHRDNVKDYIFHCLKCNPNWPMGVFAEARVIHAERLRGA